MKKYLQIIRNASRLAGGPLRLPGVLYNFIRSFGLDGVSRAVSQLSYVQKNNTTEPFRYAEFKDFSDWSLPLISEVAELDAKLGALRISKLAKQRILHPLESRLSGLISQTFGNLEMINPTSVIFTDDLGVGGSSVVALNLARGLSEVQNRGNVLLVTTSSAATIPLFRELETGVYLMDCGNLALNFTSREQMIFSYLVSTYRSVLRAIVINSDIGYQLLVNHGKLVKIRSKVYAAFFCPDFDNRGKDISYGSKYYSKLNHVVDGVISDNWKYPHDLRNDLGSEAENVKVGVFRPPAARPPKWEAATKGSGGEVQVVWASRLVRQKNYLLVKKIAKLRPQYNFLIYGTGSRIAKARLKVMRPKNMLLKGPYSDFFEIPLSDNTTFLYTSKWDGIPNVLIEAAYSKTPIVTSSSGSIIELVGISDNRALVLSADSSASEFANALDETFNDRASANVRSERLFEFVSDVYSWKSFIRSIREFFE